MSVDSIVTLISSTGFPIVCCIFMWKFITDSLNKMKDCIDSNTQVLNKLLAKLDRGGISDDYNLELTDERHGK